MRDLDLMRIMSTALGLLWTGVTLAALGFLLFDPGPQTSGSPEFVYSIGAWSGMWWLAHLGIGGR